MKSLDMSFKQVWSTDGIAASKDRAWIAVSRFGSCMGEGMSEQIFVQLIAPSAPRNGATMCVSVFLKMITKGEKLNIASLIYI